MGEQPASGAETATCAYRCCFPYLVVEAPRASDAINFYKRAFGAQEVSRTLHTKRKADQELPLISHAHLKFGGVEFMLCDEIEEAGPNVKSPATVKGTTSFFHVDTDNVDAAYSRAIEAGAKSVENVSDQPWGRYAKIVDPFGFAWSFGMQLKESQKENEAPPSTEAPGPIEAEDAPVAVQ